MPILRLELDTRALRAFDATLIFSLASVAPGTVEGCSSEKDFAFSRAFLRCAFCLSLLAAMLEEEESH